MQSPPFLKPQKALVDELESIASSSLLFKSSLTLLWEIASTAFKELEEEATYVAVGSTLLKRAKVLEHVLLDARDAAEQAAQTHLLKILWTRMDLPAVLTDQISATLDDLSTLGLGSSLDRDTIECRDQAARTADEAEMQRLLLAASRDYDLLEDLLQLKSNEHQPKVIVSAMQKNLELSSDPIQQRFLKRALEAIQRERDVVADTAPWQITSYELVIGDKLASGGYADVFRGQWRGSTVAVKILKPGRANVQANEVKKWEQLRHPHVIQLYGASLNESRPFLVMPLMKRNLRDHLLRHHDVDREAIAQQVALGVEYLHSRVPTIVHGDLKAVNVLLGADGSAVLADFGLAHSAQDEAAKTPGLNVRWLSPERIRGGGPSCAADIYAFGMLLFELYTGEVPYAEMDDDTIEWAVVQRGQRPIVEDGGMPSVMKDLMEHCWHPASTLRPTASKVVSRLSRPSPTVQPRSHSRTESLRSDQMLQPITATQAHSHASSSDQTSPLSRIFSEKTRGTSLTDQASNAADMIRVAPKVSQPKMTSPKPSTSKQPSQAYTRPSARGGSGGVLLHVEKAVASDKAASTQDTRNYGRPIGEAPSRRHSPPPFSTPSLEKTQSKVSLGSQTSSNGETVQFFGRGGAGRSTKLNLKGSEGGSGISGWRFGKKKESKAV